MRRTELWGRSNPTPEFLIAFMSESLFSAHGEDWRLTHLDVFYQDYARTSLIRTPSPTQARARKGKVSLTREVVCGTLRLMPGGPKEGPSGGKEAPRWDGMGPHSHQVAAYSGFTAGAVRVQRSISLSGRRSLAACCLLVWVWCPFQRGK